MKYAIFTILVLLSACNANNQVVPKPKVFSTDDGNSYKVICIAGTSYLQQRSNGNLTPKYSKGYHYPDMCDIDEVNHD